MKPHPSRAWHIVVSTAALLFCSGTIRAQAADARYRLSAGDVISLRFFFNPELNEDAQIRPDGDLSLQLIGEVRFAGKTAAEVAREIEQRYSTEVKMPRVTLQVKSFAAQKAYVTGEVMRPGPVSLVGGLDLVSAVAEAGGVKQTGKARTWILVRKGPSGQVMARKIASQSPGAVSEVLRPFDLVIVPARAITRVDRFVDEYIRQVLPGTLAGGFQYLYNNTSSAISVLPF